MDEEQNQQLINALTNVGYLGPIMRDLIDAMKKLTTAVEEQNELLQNRK